MTTIQLQDPGIVRVLFADLRLAGVWLAPRLYLGWIWLDAGWRRLEAPAGSAGQTGPPRLVAISETLVGIALILGMFTGVAVIIGGLLSTDAMVTGSAVMTPALFTLAIGLMLAWKTAGWIGLDRWVLPAIGMPWDGGHLFRKSRWVMERSTPPNQGMPIRK